MNFLRHVTFVIALLLSTGCVNSPRGWKNKATIEKLVHRSVSIGSSKQEAEAFFRSHGVEWQEWTQPPKAGHPHQLVAWVETGRGFLVSTSVCVAFRLRTDGKVESIYVHESHTGM